MCQRGADLDAEGAVRVLRGACAKTFPVTVCGVAGSTVMIRRYQLFLLITLLIPPSRETLANVVSFPLLAG